MTSLLLYIFFISVCILFAKKFKILPNYSGQLHQKFVQQETTPLIGGFFILILFYPILITNYKIFYLALIGIFLVGFMSDAKVLNSPKIRIILQLILTLSLVYILKLEVTPTRIAILDSFLKYQLISFGFTTFCILILVNGCNFIDGMNGLLLGYFILVLFTLNHTDLLSNLNFNKNFLFYIGASLSILLLFNFLNLFYLGDGGSYLIGFLIGCLLIFIYNNSNLISPFFIILLLWYPCFENLFSIVRKNKFKNSPIEADNKHLHQLLFYFLRKNIKLGSVYVNNLSSIIINSFNLIIFFVASSDIKNTKFQIFLIISSILIYLVSYYLLFGFKFVRKK